MGHLILEERGPQHMGHPWEQRHLQGQLSSTAAHKGWKHGEWKGSLLRFQREKGNLQAKHRQFHSRAGASVNLSLGLKHFKASTP